MYALRIRTCQRREQAGVGDVDLRRLDLALAEVDMPRLANADQEQALEYAQVRLGRLAVDSGVARQRVIAGERSRAGREEPKQSSDRRGVMHARGVDDVPLDDRCEVALEDPARGRRSAV